MKLTASIPMSKADLDALTDADLRWLEQEVSKRFAEKFMEGDPLAPAVRQSKLAQS